MWPSGVTRLAAVFLTHVETEHSGALAEVLRIFGPAPVFAPAGCNLPGAAGLADGAKLDCGGYAVETLATPGHAEAHNAYLVRAPGAGRTAASLLVSGDLIFAGSIGGAYFCRRRLREQVGRVLGTLRADTVIAPGHGPLTTLAHEKNHNPFSSMSI